MKYLPDHQRISLSWTGRSFFLCPEVVNKRNSGAGYLGETLQKCVGLPALPFASTLCESVRGLDVDNTIYLRETGTWEIIEDKKLRSELASFISAISMKKY